MPFNLESDNLPSYVKKQPLDIAKRWIDIFNQYFVSDDEATAWMMANTWLKRVIEFHKNNPPEEEKKEDIDLEVMNLTFEPEGEELVVRADGDEEFIDFILADVAEDNYGTSYDEEFLTNLAEQINRSGIVGDFNHEIQYRLKQMGIGISTIKERMKNKDGIAKAVKAIVDNGKLFIRTSFDKRYKNRILQSKGVSIEGAFVRDKKTNKFVGGTVFGFSFIDNPKLNLGNPRAVRV
jgi:SOS response regulatory protein OraA/RecX